MALVLTQIGGPDLDVSPFYAASPSVPEGPLCIRSRLGGELREKSVLQIEILTAPL